MGCHAHAWACLGNACEVVEVALPTPTDWHARGTPSMGVAAAAVAVPPPLVGGRRAARPSAWANLPMLGRAWALLL